MTNSMQTGQTGPEKLYLRFANTRDHDRLLAFYDAVKPNMDAGQRADMSQKISAGSAVLVEDADGHVQAAGLVSPVGRPGEDRHSWTLVSDIHSNIRHFDLARVMVAAGTVNGFFVDPPEMRFVAQVPQDNVVLDTFIRKNIGWTDLTPGDNCTAALAAVQDGQEAGWLECGPQQLIHAARMVQDIIDGEYGFANPATGQEYQLDVTRCSLATSLRSHVDTLAGCTHSPDEKPDPRFGLGSMARSFRLGLG